MVEKILESTDTRFDMTPPEDKKKVLEERRKRFNVKRGFYNSG